MNSEQEQNAQAERKPILSKFSLPTILFALFVGAAFWHFATQWNNAESGKARRIGTLVKDEADRELFLRIVNQGSRTANNLLEKIFSESATYTVVWNTTLRTTGGNEVELFLLDRFIRPVAGSPLPLLAIVFSKSGELQFWTEVCDNALGFVNAKVEKGTKDASSPEQIAITVRLNWTQGFARYVYILIESDAVQIGETESNPVDDEIWSLTERDILSPIPMVLSKS